MKVKKEEGIIIKVKKGNSRTYNNIKSLLSNFLNKNYPNNSESDDDVSEIIIKVYENITLYNPQKSKFNTWIINIAKNHMIDKSRSKYYKNKQKTESINELDVTGVCQHSKFELSDEISEMLKKLSPSDLELIKKKYIEGYKYDEIGKELNIDKVKICNRVNYALLKLKKEGDK